MASVRLRNAGTEVERGQPDFTPQFPAQQVSGPWSLDSACDNVCAFKCARLPTQRGDEDSSQSNIGAAETAMQAALYGTNHPWCRQLCWAEDATACCRRSWNQCHAALISPVLRRRGVHCVGCGYPHPPRDWRGDACRTQSTARPCETSRMMCRVGRPLHPFLTHPGILRERRLPYAVSQ